jgi:GT2 family glycosyltransferase
VGESSLAKTIALAMASPFGVGNAYFRYSNKAQFVDTLAFGAYKRAAFDRVGLFDENLIANEDYDLNYRIRKAGGKIFLSPTIKSFYFNRACLSGLWKQYFRYGFWKVRMLCKYPESIAIRQAVPPVFVLSLLLTMSFSLFFQPFIYLFIAIISTYLICSVTVSLRLASKQGWRHFPLLPLVFLCLHLGWGSGFLYGLTKWGAQLKQIR